MHPCGSKNEVCPELEAFDSAFGVAAAEDTMDTELEVP